MKLSAMKYTPYQCFNTEIGEVCLFEIRVKDQTELYYRLNELDPDIKSEVFFKHFIPLFAYLKKDLKSPDFERPEEYMLQQEDIEKLTVDELELIAKIFLEHNQHLYAKNIVEEKKGNDGQTVLKIKASKVNVVPKLPDESYIQCLYRLVKEEEQKRKKLFEGVGSAFSSNLSKEITNTFGFGKSLQNHIGSISKLTDVFKHGSLFSSVTEEMVNRELKEHRLDHDFTKVIRAEEERRLAPFKMLSEKIDEMIDAEEKTTEFISKVHGEQVNIGIELKESSDTSSRYAKKNLFLTIVIIFMTALTLWYTVFDSTSSKIAEDTRDATMDTNEKIDALTHSLTELAKAIQDQAEVQKNLYEQQSKEILRLEKSIQDSSRQ